MTVPPFHYLCSISHENGAFTWTLYAKALEPDAAWFQLATGTADNPLEAHLDVTEHIAADMPQREPHREPRQQRPQEKP